MSRWCAYCDEAIVLAGHNCPVCGERALDEYKEPDASDAMTEIEELIVDLANTLEEVLNDAEGMIAMGKVEYARDELLSRPLVRRLRKAYEDRER